MVNLLYSIFGPSTSKNPPKTSRTYKKIKFECQRHRKHFVDKNFPPDNSSLFIEVNKNAGIVWKRPGVTYIFLNSDKMVQNYNFFIVIIILTSSILNGKWDRDIIWFLDLWIELHKNCQNKDIIRFSES